MPLAPIPMMSVPTKPKIGFSIDSIVGGTGSNRIQYSINNKTDRNHDKTIVDNCKIQTSKSSTFPNDEPEDEEDDEEDEIINPGSPSSDVSNKFESRSPADLRYNGNRTPIDASPTNLIIKNNSAFRSGSPFPTEGKISSYRYPKTASPHRSTDQDISKFESSIHSNSPRSSISPASGERTSLSPKASLIKPSVLTPANVVPFGSEMNAAAALKGIYLPADPVMHGVGHPSHHHHPHPLALAAAAQHFQGKTQKIHSHTNTQLYIHIYFVFVLRKNLIE